METPTGGGPSQTQIALRKCAACDQARCWRYPALPDSTLLLSQFYIKIDGTEASEPMMLNLVEATVENSLHLPDVAPVTLHDPDGQWVDHANVAPGKPITISAKAGDTTQQLFDGEIVELESDFFPGERRVIVRAFDRLHRLARGR